MGTEFVWKSSGDEQWDGCTTMRMCLIPLDYTFRNGKFYAMCILLYMYLPRAKLGFMRDHLGDTLTIGLSRYYKLDH